jgi:hypothetical protein
MPSISKDKTAILSSDLYFDVFEKKGVKFLRIRRTAVFDKLQGQEFDVSSEHIWSKGDNLLRLSHKNYGDTQFWWVIGLLNGKPTDAHFSIGDVVYIPSNPYHVAELLR